MLKHVDAPLPACEPTYRAEHHSRVGRSVTLVLLLLQVCVGVAACDGGPSSPGPKTAVIPPAPPPAQFIPGETYVSLTFDDGNEELWPARDILLQNHLRGTFFIISPRIGLPGFFSMQQLQQLQQDGHEIGGHSFDHLPNLAALSPAQQQHEVCDDRKNLLSWGFPAVTFGYPYDAWSPELETVTQGCGYSQARMAHGLRNANRPTSPPVGPIPPSDFYGIPAVPSIQSTATLAELQGYVTDAQQAGGGWVVLIFHRFCDPICWHSAITPTLFSQFTSWLATQPKVTVLPIREVVQLQK